MRLSEHDVAIGPAFRPGNERSEYSGTIERFKLMFRCSEIIWNIAHRDCALKRLEQWDSLFGVKHQIVLPMRAARQIGKVGSPPRVFGGFIGFVKASAVGFKA